MEENDGFSTCYQWTNGHTDDTTTAGRINKHTFGRLNEHTFGRMDTNHQNLPTLDSLLGRLCATPQEL
jgi:hypothetical protein